MKSTLAFLALAFICSCGPASEQADQATQTELKSKATKIIEQMADGDFENQISMYDSKMKSVSASDKISAGWYGLTEKYGQYLGHDEPEYLVVGGYDTIEIIVRFQRANIPVHTVFDTDKNLAGLWFKNPRK